jgi:TetR/AcrR family transcriptional regulator
VSAAPSPRELRQARHRDLSRAQILDAAEEVFARKGFHDATVKEIGARAEFSVGAVYSFFENKEDLFAQVYVRRGGEFMDGMRRVLAQSTAPIDTLLALAAYEVTFFREHANFGRLYLRASGANLGDLESPVDASIAENYTEAMNLQAKLFRAGQESGDLRDGDPEVLAMLFSGVVSAYQATDPIVVGDPPGTSERMPLDELFDILRAAFARP